jgi:DNA-binding beta-propeller fold protein YncE
MVQYSWEARRRLVASEGLLAGRSLADYRVEELIGRGGMGEVYRALDTRLDRRVALKVLGSSLADDEAFRRRLLRESRLAASLDHPNVIPIYEAGNQQGHLFIAMRYVEGSDLRSLLRQSAPLDPSRSMAICGQIADALDAAHRRGLVHRDVKPSNVLIDGRDEHGHCYLVDFGLTQKAAEPGPADGSLLGTIDYVAPEAIRGDPLDGRSDQYALGCVLFECLTGVAPFAHASDTATIYAHLEEPIPAATDRRASLPGEIDAVLGRAMAKQPEERFESCSAMVSAARAALGLESRRPSLRRRGAFAVAAAVVAAAAAIGALILTRGGGAPAPPAGALVSIDPATNAARVVAKVSSYPEHVAVGSERVWVTDLRDGSLWMVIPRTGEVSRVSTVGDPRDVTVLGSKAYVSTDGPTSTEGNVLRYDAVTGMREDSVALVTCSITSGDGLVWTAGCPLVERLSTSPAKLHVVTTARIPFPPVLTASNDRATLVDLAIGGGSVWVLGDAADHRIFRLDARTGALQAIIPLAFVARSLAWGEGGLWVSAQIEDVAALIDPVTNRLGRLVHVGRGASGIAVGGGSVWVADNLDDTVSRIDPRLGRVTETIPVGGSAVGVAYGEGRLWVTVDVD